jgi:hypothetical protein
MTSHDDSERRQAIEAILNYDDSDFRRGYQHGYNDALDHVQLLVRNGMSFKAAIGVMLDHFNDAIDPWRYSDTKASITPPLLGSAG